MTIILNTMIRTGAVDKLLMIPAVVYGPKQVNLSITVERKEFEKIFKEAGESSVITLKGLEKPLDVLIHDVAFNAVRSEVQHIDFYALEVGKELTTDVPLEFIGESTVEKIGGMINKILHEVKVTCQPTDLPHNIEVDISTLTEIDDNILVSDLIIPKGVKIDTPVNEVVVIVAKEREEEPEEVAPEAESAEVAPEAEVSAEPEDK